MKVRVVVAELLNVGDPVIGMAVVERLDDAGR